MILRDAATTSFLSWCTDQGIVTSLQLQGSHPYRYMTWDKPDDNDNNTNNDRRTSLLTVPLSSCLIGDSHAALADRLIFEKTMLGNDSHFAPYLQMLPPSPLEDATSPLLEMPRFWGDARRSSVSNFDGGQLEERLRADAANDEERLVDAWALACVKSRTNFLEDGSYSLTPLLDMLNHDCTITTKAQLLKNNDNVSSSNKNDNSRSSSLELSVLNHSFSAGDEVFISYGDLTNLDTLCDYGFVADHNPCNVECLDVRLILSPDPVKVALASDGTIAVEALALLRRLLAATNGKDLEGRNRNTLSDFMEPLSESNELEVCSFLATELDMSAKDARRGALEAATMREDTMVATYLSARATTLEKGIETIKKKYPDLEY